MALPVSTDADSDEDLIRGSADAGYFQLPADHLSDSSESSEGPLDGLYTFNAPDAVTASQTLATGTTLNSGSFCAHNGGSPFVQNGGSVAHSYGTGSNGGGLDNGSHNHDSRIIAGQEEMQNGGVLHRNLRHDLHNNPMQNHLANPNNGGRHVVHFDGTEIHVYGQLAGLQLFANTHHTNPSYEEEDDVDDIVETERQHEEDIAVLRAKEEELACRSAPLPLERCEAIRIAMQSISLGGYRPEWADKIPEERWLHRLRER
ncbi:hypothetical protein GOP47_0004318 [Adiantum capillus-veneris]|uniref:Uncharacterized protein n=1 Tax=Adiantum capillus-veneris TaxID=13818 RepID=A0A9D4V7A0_ADICA|nr:hypothetical protein GOP47_0004318 [Adiantum capillus-veneris]